MREQLSRMALRLEEVETRLAQPETYADAALLASLSREQKELTPVVETFRRYEAAERELAGLEDLLSDPEMREMAKSEYDGVKERVEALEERLRQLLVPRDPMDGKNVVMEIRAGVGGEEAALFAHSLYRMYAMYCDRQGWRLEIAGLSETELGGVKEVSFLVEGDDAYRKLKHESGVHRVQRVPETESGGRIHTSTATVAVLPEMEAAEVDIRPEDIEMQVYRSSGAGGQHINKTSSAVRLIHKPTGIVVACQEERSQFQNREKAMNMLASKLYEMEQEKLDAAVSGARKSQVGMGMRNEKIRTYNFPQDRVTDHRIGLTLHNIQGFMDGDLDGMIDALTNAAQAEKLKSGGSEEP